MIKAIETNYNGYKFRSRLEARWAVLLDSLGEKYEYEPEGYELESGKYLPDFYLPRLQCWLEIKGIKPNEKELRKCAELAELTDNPSVIAWGFPYKNTQNITIYCNFMKESGTGGGYYWLEDFFLAIDKNGQFVFCDNYDREHNKIEYHTSEGRIWDGVKSLFDINGPVPDQIINIAKSARFEFNKQHV